MDHSHTDRRWLDESDVSKDISLTISALGDSNRSAEYLNLSPYPGGRLPLISSDRSMLHESKMMMDNNECDEEGEGAREIRGGAPSSEDEEEMIGDGMMSDKNRQRVTPASTRQFNPSTNLSGRLQHQLVPPLPMNIAAASARHISPATPMPLQVGIASGSAAAAAAGITRSETPPSTSGQSYESALLACLYQSSRRSRTNTPATPGHPSIMPPSTSGSLFPPPPPLYAGRTSSTTTKPANMERDASGGNSIAVANSGTSDPHKISLQSSHGSAGINESWRSSMSSLMHTSSFLNTSFNASFSNVYNHSASIRSSMGPSEAIMEQEAVAPGPLSRPGHTGEITTSGKKQPSASNCQRPNLWDYKIEDRTSNRTIETSHISYLESLQEAVEGTVHETSDQQQRPSLWDYRIEDRTSHRSLDLASSSMIPGQYNADACPSLPTSTADERRRLAAAAGRPKLNFDYKMEDKPEDQQQGQYQDVLLTVPTLSGDSAEDSRRNNTTSPSIGCMEQLSSLQLRRSRQEFEGPGSDIEGLEREHSGSSEEFGTKRVSEVDNTEDAAGEGVSFKDNALEQPKKKYKKRLSVSRDPQEDYLTPQTNKSCLSFDIIAEPSSRVSSILEFDVSPSEFKEEIDMQGLLNADAEIMEQMFEVDAAKDHEMGVLRMHEEARRGQGAIPTGAEGTQDLKIQEGQDQGGHVIELPSEKDQRILRRKIQRLLLIRHCSTCPVPPPSRKVPPPPLVAHAPTGLCSPCGDNDEGKNRQASHQGCPVTSHCAEGKALCAHIRTCKLGNCTYKKCLTSREVLGHYKNCKNRFCEICGPVRALDRKKDQKGGPQRRRSDSSIETIDDEGWLNANMMCIEDPSVSGNPEECADAE